MQAHKFTRNPHSNGSEINPNRRSNACKWINRRARDSSVTTRRVWSKDWRDDQRQMAGGKLDKHRTGSSIYRPRLKFDAMRLRAIVNRNGNRPPNVPSRATANQLPLQGNLWLVCEAPQTTLYFCSGSRDASWGAGRWLAESKYADYASEGGSDRRQTGCELCVVLAFDVGNLMWLGVLHRGLQIRLVETIVFEQTRLRVVCSNRFTVLGWLSAYYLFENINPLIMFYYFSRVENCLVPLLHINLLSWFCNHFIKHF